MKTLVIIFSLCCAALWCNANTYYVSSSGNDENSGLSMEEAWQTLAKVDTFAYAAGDSILFKGGEVFDGMLYSSSLGNATLSNPIVFGSYGTGKGIINSKNLEAGLYIENASNITIRDLIFKGDSYLISSVWSAGLYIILTGDATEAMSNIIVDNVESFGYGGWGIKFMVFTPKFGYKNLRVTNCDLHNNGVGGLNIGGYWDAAIKTVLKSSNDVYFGYNKSYNNLGRFDYKDNWSGSGILMTGVVNGTIEYCEAYENGNENGSTYAGPVGIFFGECKNVVVQYCKSHNNHGGVGQRDGGGFDMDGGAEASVIQYCETYENDGAGYGLYHYETQNAWTNDTVRYCTSTNDGRLTWLYGAITFWGVNGLYRVTNAQVYGNTIKMDKAGTALQFLNNQLTNVQVYDNVFCLSGPAVYSNTIPSNATVTNSSFPCAVLSLKNNSFNVKRIR